MKWEKRADSRGFTLLEILVALSVMGIALTMVVQLFSGSLRMASLSQSYNQAAQLAERKMAEVMASEEPPDEKGSTETGNFNESYTWEVVSTPYEELKPEDERGFPLELYRMEVKVTWKQAGKERRIILTSIKSFLKSDRT